MQPTTGFYDPNNQFAAATSLGVAANNRDGSAANLNSLTGTGSNTSSSAIGGSSSSAQPSAFTSTTTAANVSTTSPGPNAITTSASTGSGSQHAHHVQKQVTLFLYDMTLQINLLNFNKCMLPYNLLSVDFYTVPE